MLKILSLGVNKDNLQIITFSYLVLGYEMSWGILYNLHTGHGALLFYKVF